MKKIFKLVFEFKAIKFEIAKTIYQCRGIGYFGAALGNLETKCGQSQYGGNAEADPISGVLPVYPERHPADHDDQPARKIDLNQKVARMPSEK